MEMASLQPQYLQLYVDTFLLYSIIIHWNLRYWKPSKDLVCLGLKMKLDENREIVILGYLDEYDGNRLLVNPYIFNANLHGGPK